MIDEEMNGITIESNVPMPNPWGAKAKYPYRQLEIGQSFEVECRDLAHMASIRSSVSRLNKARNFGGHLVVRRIPDTDSTIGVWRVK